MVHLSWLTVLIIIAVLWWWFKIRPARAARG